jgi:hypothetical protein
MPRLDSARQGTGAFCLFPSRAGLLERQPGSFD